MDAHLLAELNRERRARHAVILATDLNSGASRLIREGEPLSGELSEAVLKAFRSGKSGQVEADGRTLFLNVHLPPARLVVIGAVHISQALAPMAAIADFDLEIIDPRTAFATPERFGAATLHAEWPEDVLKRRPLDAWTALAAVTHDPKIDDYPLQAALEAGCFYVGALGSRKTHAKRLERLAENGVDRAKLERIHAPIGLPIGAASPAEIAVATLAQIIAALRSRDGAAAPGREGAT
ncbi:XdhC family protein [Chelativorans sp. ZYF759]|uniref:XdhC family protein n=1 Tax=Chelativorans sp. ZYF759 TaxID=2692213 RepID=UPI00145CCFB5|nr:XdhC family protein [Chelativorans sp. ZYF759]NMG39940.1 XdhC family protein [Chelativorans sp. ZYF759]